MAMSKQDFVALADAIREHNKTVAHYNGRQFFSDDQIKTLADFCQLHNSRFMRERWLTYIAGECGKNGGAIRKEYQPKTGAKCGCKPGIQRDNCPACEGTGMVIDFAAIRARK